MSVSRHRLLFAASLVVLCTGTARAQRTAPKRDLHDSITVTTLTFPGATHVSTDDLKPLIFTRASPCRLPFLIPVCKLTPSQLFTDRRRTLRDAQRRDTCRLAFDDAEFHRRAT